MDDDARRIQSGLRLLQKMSQGRRDDRKLARLDEDRSTQRPAGAVPPMREIPVEGRLEEYMTDTIVMRRQLQIIKGGCPRPWAVPSAPFLAEGSEPRDQFPAVVNRHPAARMQVADVDRRPDGRHVPIDVPRLAERDPSIKRSELDGPVLSHRRNYASR